MKILLCFLSIFLLVSICSCKGNGNSNTSIITVEDNNEINKLNDFFKNPFLNFELKDNEDEIIKELGEPSEIQKYLGSPRCGIIDTTGDITKLQYNGLGIELYSDCGIQRILITNNNYQLKYDIKIGSKKDYIYGLFNDDISDLMSNLDEVKNGSKLIYNTDDPCREVTFYFDNDILTKIEL